MSMSKSANIVLYRVDKDAAGKSSRHPIFSCDADDEMAQPKVAYNANKALQSAEQSGAVAPVLVAVRETREANEMGHLEGADYQRLALGSLSPRGKSAATIDDVFAA